MQQTIQFNPEQDNVQVILDAVARAFGFTDLAALTEGATPAAEALPEDYDRMKVQPWTQPKAYLFINELTTDAQRGLALMTASTGSVPVSAMRSYLGVTSLQGVFSTFGAAARNTRGLKTGDRPFQKNMRPAPHYDMDVDMRLLFQCAFAQADKISMVEDAQDWFMYQRKAEQLKEEGFSDDVLR
jgi:hypothetical protein